MNRDEIRGGWKQLAGKVKTKWGTLTDDDQTQIDGKKDQLIGKLQAHYGHSKEVAEKYLRYLIKSLHRRKLPKPAHPGHYS
jgi:uncharacterized protein YjbJ (UPF0337 family)